MRRPVWGRVASSQPGSSASEHVQRSLLPDDDGGPRTAADGAGRVDDNARV